MEQPCQRWTERRARYRPSGERIDPSRYGVDLVADGEARRFTERHHYSGSWPAVRLSVGLYRSRRWITPELVGVAAFSVGVQPRALPRWTGVGAAEGVELGRFVLVDDVPGNGESWFLARAFRALRSALPAVQAVLSYSDPLRRLAEDGTVVTPGHIGVIYQAHNARYHGLAAARTIYVDAHGRTISRRAIDKIRGGERGWEGAARRLVDGGAPHRRPGEDPADWIARVLAGPSLRPVRHPGNHVYSWRLDGGEGGASRVAYPRQEANP